MSVELIEKKKLEQVLSIDQKVSSILDLNHLVDFVSDQATHILEAEKCSLMLLDEATQELVIRGAKGLDGQIIKETRIKVGDQISGMVAKEGRPLLICDIEEDERLGRKNRSHYKGKSFLSVPIKMHNKVVGVVNISDKNSQTDSTNIFTEIDLRILCTIVRQASIAVENANYCRDLEHLSSTDSMTGLFNHRHFVKCLDQEIGRIKRYPQPLCLLMLDVDDFKTYNDTHGHLRGDDLLKEVANILKENLRDIDIVCRYAGDEFVAILPETDIKQAQVVGLKIKEAVSDLDLKESITVSIGMAKCAKGMDQRDLIMKADQALYEAKGNGKNRICCYS
ncbi:GGDEF domain protein [hydrothermal vent metagenome]|uniref:GGDEF domain protein n=1 Tax=hydrothermal vent metagenome TaxID=652676 RepID=A0A3B1DGS8_9ZZZZ